VESLKLGLYLYTVRNARRIPAFYLRWNNCKLMHNEENSSVCNASYENSILSSEENEKLAFGDEKYVLCQKRKLCQQFLNILSSLLTKIFVMHSVSFILRTAKTRAATYREQPESHYDTPLRDCAYDKNHVPK
jgi:hypothetical protein